MFQLVRIPARRVAALMGKEGKVKKRLEKATETRISVDRSGGVQVEGEAEGLLTAVEVVKAIGRGFPPEKAFLLLDEANQLTVLSLEGETEKTIERLMSRVIGRQGRAKKNIERLTGASLCVQGKTVAIIGIDDGLDAATRAVEDLLKGRTHGYVYTKLEKNKRLSRKA